MRPFREVGDHGYSGFQNKDSLEESITMENNAELQQQQLSNLFQILSQNNEKVEQFNFPIIKIQVRQIGLRWLIPLNFREKLTDYYVNDYFLCVWK